MSQDSLSAWYADFFTELPNTFWRSAVPMEATRREIAFLAREAGLRDGSRVLDVPCGSGRHALELAGLGCRVTGLDVSAEAIGFARAEAARRGLDVDLRVGDMRVLPGDPVDAAICMGNALGYLEHTGTERFLADLAGVVVPGGTLVLDTAFVAEGFLHGLALDEEPMTIGGVEAASVNTYDVVESRWLTSFTFRRGDEVHTGTSVQHVYTSGELVRLLRAAGFGDVVLHADPDGTPYALGSPRLLLTARRA